MWTMEPLAKTTPSRRTLWQLVPQTLRYARFNRHEIAGSLGDLGTFLPLLVGMSAQNGLNFASALFFAGLFNIVTGLTFSIPMAVQPMKAIAAVALTEGLTTPRFLLRERRSVSSFSSWDYPAGSTGSIGLCPALWCAVCNWHWA